MKLKQSVDMIRNAILPILLILCLDSTNGQNTFLDQPLFKHQIYRQLLLPPQYHNLPESTVAPVAVAVAPAGAAAVPCGYCTGANGQPYVAVRVTEAPTTTPPRNQFNNAGWETDDNGNVYVGDDNAKLYLIAVGSFWPFPKDYRKKRSVDEREINFLKEFKF